MANKLEDMMFKSVDLVRRGANPDSDIKLFKSFYGDPENAQVVMKSESEIEEMILKSDNLIDGYTDVLKESLSSIVNDTTLSATEAREMMAKSITEFNATMLDDVIKEFSYESEENEEEGVEDPMATINRKNLSKAENDQLNELLKKACGSKKQVMKEDPEIIMEDEEEEDPMEKERKAVMEKSAMHPAVKAALERMENITKNLEMKELEEVAKKYEPLGEKSEELAKTLYDMKQQGEDVYKQYVSVLDKSLDVINKSGLFGEIGKSAYYGGIAKSDAEGKIETIAGEIAKSNPGMTRQQALAKAWEQNPEIAMEYEDSRR